jgi:protein-disulfide isomerase
MTTWLFRILLVCSAWLTTLGVTETVAWAQSKTCDALNGEQKALARSLLTTERPYDCCDKTLAQCLEKKPVCNLVRRLTDDICRRVAKGQSRADIQRELARRASSMVPAGKRANIDEKATAVAGSADAKVTVSVYLCPRCPFCARLVPELYESVTKGRLAGKVRLIARPFPVRTHPGSTEAGLGMVAANRLGRFWEFLLQLYRDFDRFDPARVDEVAERAGLDREAFKKTSQEPGTRQMLVEAKKEGVRNSVDSTPTFFINGRKYQGEMTREVLEDVLEEEFERVTGKTKS